MRRKQSLPYLLLLLATITGIVLLPFAILKRSFKDWIIVYLVSIIGNYLSDLYLVSKGYLKYKNKLFPQSKVHIPFDFIHYPLMLLYYNQWTLNSNPAGIILKLFPFVIPQTLIEALAEKKTNLIKWDKGWTWFHSFISLVIKLLLCRNIIACIRIINKEKYSV